MGAHRLDYILSSERTQLFSRKEFTIMKKNKMMRVAACLLIAVMLSTCAFGGTFAKYTTADTDGSDSARVAKWGVTVLANAGDKTTEGSAFSKGNGVTVSATEDLVAPGTSGTLATIEVAGNPEVSGKITYSVDLTLTGWTIDSGYYCPLVITVGSTALKGTDYTGMAEFEAAVEGEIKKALTGDAATAEVTFNADADTAIDASVSVAWSWAFTTDTTADANDTKLGNLDTAPTIAFAASATVEQTN